MARATQISFSRGACGCRENGAPSNLESARPQAMRLTSITDYWGGRRSDLTWDPVQIADCSGLRRKTKRKTWYISSIGRDSSGATDRAGTAVSRTGSLGGRSRTARGMPEASLGAGLASVAAWA